MSFCASLKNASYMSRSGVNQAQRYDGDWAGIDTFGNVGMCQILLKNENTVSIRPVRW